MALLGYSICVTTTTTCPPELKAKAEAHRVRRLDAALSARSGVFTLVSSAAGVCAFILGAGGAIGAIAWGGAPQRGAPPQEYEAHNQLSPSRGGWFKIVVQNRNKSLNVWRKNHYVIHTLESYCHLVFSTHDRLRWIDKSWQECLAQYIGGIVRDIVAQ
jgi:hypothetical protein